MINKVGVTLVISKVGSLDAVASGRTLVDTRDNETVAAATNEFLYFAAKAIAGDEPNGNGDFFPWSQLLKSHSTFVGRNMFLNHQSQDPRNAIGKVLDAYPVVDASTGEKYIECLCKIDAKANPELARQLSTSILDSVSMGCSVMTSMCSICGHTIHSDQDEKCLHLGRGLLREYLAELDLPDFNIKKGNRTQAYSINQGLNFTELSVVNVPAWSNAKIVQVISQLKDEIQKFASDKKEVPTHLTNELEDLLKMIPKKADLNAPAAEAVAPEVVAAPAETKVEATEGNTLKKILSEKLSAFEYLDLVDFITTRAKKDATKISAASVAEIKAEEAPKMEAKAESVAKIEEKLEVKAEAVVATPEIVAEAPKVEAAAEVKIEAIATPAEVKVEAAPKSEYRAIFVSKPSIKESYWVVTDKGLPVLKATLEKIWGDMLPTRATYAASWEYGNFLLSRLAADGVEKVASILDATVLTKEAAGAVGKDQYKPAAPHAPAKLKKTDEQGVDMDGGGFPAPAAAGTGKEWPSQKAVGKDQYKPVGKGHKASEEAPIEIKAEMPCSCDPKCAEKCMKAEAAAPKHEEMPKMDEAPKHEEVPKAEHAETPMPELKAEEMSDEEKLAHMEKLLEAMSPSDKLTKPMDALCKAFEKFQGAMAKVMEADAKAAEKAEAAAAKEAEKAEKAAEKDAKAAEKAEAKAEKAEAKEEPKEEPKEEAPAKEEKEASADPKLDAEKHDVELAEEAKKAITELEKHEKAEVKEMEHAAAVAPKVEIVAAPTKSDRELQLEAELSVLRSEKSLRAKAEFCKQVVSIMVEKRLVSADESDVQKLTTEGTPLFDARAQAFKLAADRQHALLLKMDSDSLKAFAESIDRIAKPTGTTATASFRMNNMPYAGGTDGDWLKSVVNSMGSQKGR